MTRSRFLGDAASPTQPSTTVDPSVDSSFALILAALVCSLICILGLIAVARCAWLRRFSQGGGATNTPPPEANKGVKKKVLESLPKQTYYPNDVVLRSTYMECAICLTEFVEGDDIRLLPQCGHGFHATCIDTWLGAHSTCPSCRKILVVAARCQKCGELAEVETASSSSARREEQQVPSFSPLYLDI